MTLVHDAYAPYTDVLDDAEVEVERGGAYSLYQPDDEHADTAGSTPPSDASAAASASVSTSASPSASAAASAPGVASVPVLALDEQRWLWNARYQSAVDARDDAAIAALTEAFFLTACARSPRPPPLSAL